MKNGASILVAAVLATASFVTAARSESSFQPLGEFTSQSLPEQRQAVIRAFEPGERFAELDKAGRQQVLDAFDRMQERVAVAGSIEALEPGAELEVFNDQELINEILTEAQRDSRINCKRNRTVNSRIKTSECHTVAEWERRRERARELAEKNKRFVTCIENPSDGGSWCGN